MSPHSTRYPCVHEDLRGRPFLRGSHSLPGLGRSAPPGVHGIVALALSECLWASDFVSSVNVFLGDLPTMVLIGTGPQATEVRI